MTPEEFVEKWKKSELKERSAAQEHFIDLCNVLSEETPAQADPKGEWYCFERGATKTTGGEGWADVWKRGCFGWEYKGKRKDLDAAFAQLQQYSVALENPPLLVVCDMERFIVHTNWTNTVSEIHEITLDDFESNASKRDVLKWVMSDPERLKPKLTRDALTAAAASRFAEFAGGLAKRGHAPLKVAHFVNRLVFCMFAEDVDLLPHDMFTRVLEHSFRHPDEFEALTGDLFRAMKDGGRIGLEKVEWFNGGLFNDGGAIPLERDEIKLVWDAAKMNWADIDPSIFGTLFERGLDPDKRGQLGAHYTDRGKIMQIVDPIVVRPLVREWDETKKIVERELENAEEAKARIPKTQTEAKKVYAAARRAEERARRAAQTAFNSFMGRLRSFVVLDPACGSGNFLYLSLLALKDLEHRVIVEGEALGLHKEFPQIGPESVRGIELNPYAAELARVTVWIGEIQWMKRNGYSVGRRPILRPLDNIEQRDAVVCDGGGVANWPDAHVAVGNPPYLGNKKQISVLGEEYTLRLRDAYSPSLPGSCDLVCYWFERARQLMNSGNLNRAGFVATKTIASKTNRPVLGSILEDLAIYDVSSNEEWVVEGADVRVALICFANKADPMSARLLLDGRPVVEVFSDLTGRTETGGLDLTSAESLTENRNVAFQGVIKTGAFDIPADLAREWLRSPLNPNGRPNSDVLRPLLNGSELTKKPPERWIIDFGASMTEREASFYELPFAYVEKKVKEKRKGKRESSATTNWWLHQRPRPHMRKALEGFDRCIVTSRVSRHRVFVWLSTAVVPDSRLERYPTG